MLRVRKITVKNFRGIRLPISLEFEQSGKPVCVALYGRNGTGKSSVVDAWEWLLNSVVKHLDKEGISPRDYPHKACLGENSSICVEFFNSEIIKNVTAEFNTQKVRTPNLSGEYAEFKDKSKYPNYLRAADLQEFVYFTKTEKYNYIAKFFGLEEFSTKQSLLKTGLGKVEQLLNQHRYRYGEQAAKLKK
jgi:AAA15 family ATPase/GTPase